jgi:hypothetical protein
MRLLSIKTSSNPSKKYEALFDINGKQKKVSFGAKKESGEPYSDFTVHKDEERKSRYLARHAAHENWNDPTTAGALSRWILWNKPTLKESIADFKKRFNV